MAGQSQEGGQLRHACHQVVREDHKFKSDKPVAKAVQGPSSPKRGAVPVKSVDCLGKPVIRVGIDRNI